MWSIWISCISYIVRNLIFTLLSYRYIYRSLSTTTQAGLSIRSLRHRWKKNLTIPNKCFNGSIFLFQEKLDSDVQNWQQWESKCVMILRTWNLFHEEQIWGINVVTCEKGFYNELKKMFLCKTYNSIILFPFTEKSLFSLQF